MGCNRTRSRSGTQCQTVGVRSRGGWRRPWVAVLGLLTALLASCGGAATKAGPLTGTWHVHTFYLTVQSDGTGTFQWPIHLTCGTGVGKGPSPCDTVSSSGEISDGGHATLTIERRSGSSAAGMISATTDRTTVTEGGVKLSLGANDVLYLKFSAPPATLAYSYVCGPKTNRALINCGA